MKGLGRLICVLSLAIGGVACGGTPDSDTTAASGGPTDASSVEAVQQEEGSSGEQAQPNEQTEAALPPTASPLPLAALLGVLALGAGIGMRCLRCR